MPKRKEPELDPKEQFKRFQEAARAAGVDSKQAEDKFSQLTQPVEPEKRKSTSKS